MQEHSKDISDLVNCILWINQKGWSPATSTNYSMRNPSVANEMYISKSGVDKQFFTANDFMLCETNGIPLPAYSSLKPSAETAIHAWLYQRNSETQCILHTHSLFGTVLSKNLHEKGERHLRFSGYEVQKAFPGIDTHESIVDIPILANEQDMAKFIGTLEHNFEELPASNCFLMAGHGLYTWGKNLAEAKRHLEACEFLMQCYYQNSLIS